MTETEAAKPKRTLVIRGSEWLRGELAWNAEGKNTSRLGREADGRFCCLGLDARDRGVPLELLYDAHTPEDLGPLTYAPGVDGYLADWTTLDEEAKTVADNEDAIGAMEANDDHGCTDAKRIEWLRPIFAAQGIELDWRPEE